MNINLEKIQEAAESYEKFKESFNWDDIPRFQVNGMNQAEFIQHVFISGFCRDKLSETDTSFIWNKAVEACADKFDATLLEAMQGNKSPKFEVGFLSELKKK